MECRSGGAERAPAPVPDAGQTDPYSRETKLRMRSIAVLSAAALMLVGCSSGAESGEPPQGPNGYTLSTTAADGSVLWWDRSEESGLTDLILEDPQGRFLASCLGAGPLLCVAGPEASKGVLVIAPAGAERAVMTWYGQQVELVRGESVPADAPPVFVGVMPPALAEGGYSLQVLDGAGAVIMAQ